jgi:hypothetical protein
MNWFVREKDDYMFLYESYYYTRMRDKHVNITWVADFRTTEEDKQIRYDV